jgi:hypothetical protein
MYFWASTFGYRHGFKYRSTHTMANMVKLLVDKRVNLRKCLTT